MAKYSNNNIESLTDDWGYDKVNGLPYSGKSVQKFIKDNLGAITRACFFDTRNATLLWFASEELRDAYRDDPDSFDRTKILYSVPIVFSSDLFRINLTNYNGSTSINIATNEDKLVLSIGFQVQQKSVTETVWHGTERSVKVVAYMDAGATGIYTPLHEPQVYSPSQNYEIDVRSYLIAGANRVKIQFVDEEDDSISATLTYSISLTNLYIELMDNTWYLPIVEGGDEANYKLGGFKIVGSVNKVVHFDIYSAASDVKIREFSYNLYTQSFDVTAFSFVRSYGFDLGHKDGLPDLTTGVYLVSVYLTSGTGDDMLTTDAINYNIMYITAADVTSAQLVCMNSVSDEVYNYTDSEMFHYAIYNKNINVGSPHIVVNTITGTSPTELENRTLQNIETGVEQVYTVSLNWLTDETVNLFVSATMEYGNTQFAQIPVDNSKTFPPTRGYDFFFNAASRDNSNANYLKIVNEVNKQELTPTWDRMVWVDGVDGWIHDDINKKALYVRAGSSMSLPFTEKTFVSGDNISLEMCYRVSNVADYDETVISIADDRDSVGFRGIRIRPTSITVHSSSDEQQPNDYLRSVSVMDEEIIHFVLTINKGAGGTNKNLVTGYINGCKNFQFDYATTSQWLVQGPLVVGAEKSDVSVYCIRTYPFVLSSRNVQDNYINSIEFNDRAELKKFIKSATESDESTISYESVKNNNNNFFVIEMLNGQLYPSAANGWTRSTNGLSNIEMHFGEHPEWDWKAYGAYTTGQGTTSMGYYRWNIRWRVDDKSIGKKAPVSYLSSRTKVGNKYVYEWADSATVKSFNFDGSGRHPKTSRITAKINFASSMQSHKMGATFAYNELHNNIDRSSESDSNTGLLNEAQVFAMDNSMPMPSVSVYQYPAYGFVKLSEDNYQFIGLFTIGPDKGDKSTFGFNIDDSISDTLITLEGTDHDRDVVMFGYPWDQNMIFKTSDECLNVTSGDDRGGWEVGNCYTYDTGVETDAAGINSILYQEFKPAYDAVFNNSTMIFGIDPAEYDNASPSDILAAINSDPAIFGSLRREGNRFPNSSYQFWIDGEYVLYYRSASGSRQYVAGIDLEDTLGTPIGNTVAEKNEWFKEKRRENFRAVAESYWDIQDTLFHYAFIMCIGAVDNFGKNTYPYKMKPLASGGRWRWIQDDLDSILGINNAGYDNVPTWSEYEDGTYYGGSASVFWTLIKESYMENYISTVSGLTCSGIRSMGNKILNKMNSLVGGTDIFHGVLDYFKTRFWGKAQKYFPISAYNYDATFKYEAAWIAGANAQAAPLPQSLGDHYSAEYRWVYNRLMYVLSLFRAGPFGNVEDKSLGIIGFRPENLLSITVTPFYIMYPAIRNGQIMENGGRTNPGEERSFVGPYSPLGQTQMGINASHMLSDIGDLKDLRLASSGLTTELSIEGRKLARLKIGDEDAYNDTVITPAVYYTQEEISAAEEGDDAYGKTTSDVKTPAVYDSNVKTNVQYLTFSDVPCMEELEARNASSLVGSIDLSPCKRLRKAYLSGTNITGIVFANGQPIEEVSFPDTISTISMKNMRFLTQETTGFPSDMSGISLLQIENCGFDALEMLADAYNSEGSSLTNISITLPGITDIDYALMAILSGLATNKDKDGNAHNYHGVNTDGSPADTGTPNIIGSVQLTTPFYMDTFEALGMNPSSERDYGEDGLKINGIPSLGSLQLIYDPNNVYIPFRDDTVKSICINTWGDGVGLTTVSAASVSSLSTTFNSNTSITSFDELEYFTGLTGIYGTGTSPYGAFANCTSLQSVTIPSTVTSIGNRAFLNNSALEEITFKGTSSITISTNAFSGCSNLAKVNIPSVNSFLGWSTTADTNTISYGSSKVKLYVDGNLVTDIAIPNFTTSIRTYCFHKIGGVERITMPDSIRTISDSAFRSCYDLISININYGVTEIGGNAFRNCKKIDTLIVPETVTTFGQFAFEGCFGLTDFIIKSSDVPADVLCSTGNPTSAGNGLGNGAGLLYIGGNIGCSSRAGGVGINFNSIIICGNASFSTSGRDWINYSYSSVEDIRIYGSVLGKASSNSIISGAGAQKIKFIEVLGIIDKATIVDSANAFDSTVGGIIHLGYDAVENDALPCTPSQVQASSVRATKIYVGDGSSAAHDQAIRDMYLADSNWSSYSSKLDIWYNYSGDYKTAPTIPE